MARHLRAALAQVKAQARCRLLPVDVDQLAHDAGWFPLGGSLWVVPSGWFLWVVPRHDIQTGRLTIRWYPGPVIFCHKSGYRRLYHVGQAAFTSEGRGARGCFNA
jgi:hypothetical protein